MHRSVVAATGLVLVAVGIALALSSQVGSLVSITVGVVALLAALTGRVPRARVAVGLEVILLVLAGLGVVGVVALVAYLTPG